MEQQDFHRTRVCMLVGNIIILFCFDFLIHLLFFRQPDTERIARRAVRIACSCFLLFSRSSSLLWLLSEECRIFLRCADRALLTESARVRPKVMCGGARALLETK